MIQLLTLDTWVDTIARYCIDECWDIEGCGLIDGNPPRSANFAFSLFFVGFIGLGVFVFWNLITAIIVETAFSIAESDANSQARELEMKKKAELASLAEIFLEIDVDGSGELTSDEFFGALRNKKVKQMLDVLDVQASELEEVWYVLDDGDGLLTIKEFTTGIRRMRGQAQAKDLADTVKRLRHATRSADELLQQTTSFHSAISVIEGECARIANDTGRMVGLFHEMYHRLNDYMGKMRKQDKEREAQRKKAKLKAAQEEALKAMELQPAEEEDE